MPSVPSSLSENAEGGPGCRVVIPWLVGWVRARICTLGRAPLAGGQEPAQGQAKLMQHGPIVAGPAEGMQLCWPLPRGSSGEGGPALRAGWSCLLWVCSDSGGKHAFHGSTQSPRLCACA